MASILPVHALVSGVMGDVGSAHLLIRGGASPHLYQLRPSDAAALSRAELVVWIGPGLETFLERTVANLASRGRALALAEVAGLAVHPARTGGRFRDDHDSHEHERMPDGAPDPHVWLNPRNAARMASAIADALVTLDPSRAERYRANERGLRERLARFDAQAEARLAPVRGRPFLVMHDGYQYFERRYGLTAAGTVLVHPGRQPGARRLLELRAAVRNSGVRCIFAEPQLDPRLVDTVSEGTGVRRGQLDALGAGLEPGVDAYFTMMESNVASALACLGD